MARTKRNKTLSVILNGRLVGRLARLSSGATTFAYDRDWLDADGAMPISLSLPLREQTYTGDVVFAYFDNLLPDNVQIRRKVAERVGAQGNDAYSLLDKIGRDCVGALQFIPDDEDIVRPTAPETLPLRDSEIASIIKSLSVAPLGMGEGYEREFRISIAGAQEKTALYFDEKAGWCLPIGMTPTTHIIKPQIGKLANGLDMSESVENEHFCQTLCRNLGLEVAKTEIIDFDDTRVLAIERFDRLWARDGRLLRLPQEDFCQALSVPPELKYNSQGGPGILECLSLLNGSDYAEDDRRAFMKAQIIFWLMGATDGHAKNFSVFLTPSGRFRMTPLYDVLSAQTNFDASKMTRREYKLAMAVGQRRHYPIYRIFPRHFVQTAKSAGMPKGQVEDIFEELNCGLQDALKTTCNQMPNDFPMVLAESIGSAVRDRLELYDSSVERSDTDCG